MARRGREEGRKRRRECVRGGGLSTPSAISVRVTAGGAAPPPSRQRRSSSARENRKRETLTSSSPVATVLTESMLCDSGASIMQASLPDGPGLPGAAAVRAGGGDESTVSRLGRFSAGGVMVVPAKTTGASRTYHWKITFPSRETLATWPPPPPPPRPPPRLLSFPDAVLLLTLSSSRRLPPLLPFLVASFSIATSFSSSSSFAFSRPESIHFFFRFLPRPSTTGFLASATSGHPTTTLPSLLHLSHAGAREFAAA